MEAKIIFTQIDSDGSGGLDKDEFMNALKVLRNEADLAPRASVNSASYH